MSGISSRQGSHQVAKKFMTSGLPRKVSRPTGFPSIVFRSKWIAATPTLRPERMREAHHASAKEPDLWIRVHGSRPVFLAAKVYRDLRSDSEEPTIGSIAQKRRRRVFFAMAEPLLRSET